MRLIIKLSVILILLAGCDSMDAPDCLKTSGDPVEITYSFDPFTKIEVNQEFDVIIRHGNNQQVSVKSFENLMDKIKLEVIDGRLLIQNKNSCNWVRDYDYPEVLIEVPELTEIRQNGGGAIKSGNLLNYPELTLISEHSTGDFELEVDLDHLIVVNNDLSNYYINGTAQLLTVGFFAGNGRFEGAELEAEQVSIFHRGTNDITVYATQELTGRIISTGDLLYVKTKPATIDVTEENLGKLIDLTD